MSLNTRLQQFLLCYRSTPHATTKASPSGTSVQSIAENTLGSAAPEHESGCPVAATGPSGSESTATGSRITGRRFCHGARLSFRAIPAGSPPALRINKVSIIRSKPIRVCVGGGTSIRFDLRRRHCRSLHSLLIGLIVRKHPRRLKHLKLGEERKLPQSPNTKSCRQ